MKKVPCSLCPVVAKKTQGSNRIGRQRSRNRRAIVLHCAQHDPMGTVCADQGKRKLYICVRSTPVKREVLPGRNYSAGLEDRLARDNISTKVQSNRLHLGGTVCRAVKLAVTCPILLVARIIATRNGKNLSIREMLSRRSNGTTGFFGTGMN